MRLSGRSILTYAPVMGVAASLAASPTPAQGIASRAASVALTVVVPPRLPLERGVASLGTARIVRETATAIDVETWVAVNRPASRIEVRLADSWTSDSSKVWIQTSDGRFERLGRTSAVVVDVPPDRARARPSLTFRIQRAGASTPPSAVVPIEFRLRTGSGDHIAVWSFRGLIHPDEARRSPGGHEP